MKVRNIVLGSILGSGIVYGGFLGGSTFFDSITESFKKESLERKEREETELNMSNTQITAVVLDKMYRPAIGNNKETIPSVLSLAVRTNDGKLLALNITDGTEVKKETLDIVVHKDTTISFQRGNLSYQIMSFGSGLYLGPLSDDTYFHEGTQAGSKRADRITWK